MKRISNATFGLLCTVPGLIAMIMLIIYPVFYNFVVSLFRYNNITPLKFAGLTNYSRLLTSSDFWQAWKISAIYSVGTSLLTFLVSLVLAQSLNRIRVGRAFFRTLIVLPWAVPLILSGLMWKWILDGNIGLVNYLLLTSRLIGKSLDFLSDPALALVSGILATTYVYIPFVTVLIHAGLQTIPSELYQVAEIDGADVFHKFFRITVPLNRTQMFFSVIVVWMFTFRTPDVFVMLTKGGPGKATYHAGLYLMDTIYRFLKFGEGATIGVLMFLSIVVVVLPLVYFGIQRPGAR